MSEYYEEPNECKVCMNNGNDYCFACNNGNQFKPMTNADRIRSSSDEKLAVICEDGCPPGDPNCNSIETIEGETVKGHCQRHWLKWLKSPVEEADE